jgi:hypothetical protein
VSVVALCLAFAALAWDPLTEAAAPQRALLLVVALGAAVLRSGRGRHPPPAALAWCAAAACVLPHASSADALTLVAGGAVLFATLRFDEATLRELAERVAALCSLAGLAAIAQALCGARGLGLHGGQGNPDWLALLLAAAAPLTLAWAHRRGGLGWAALAVELIGLGLARSRTAWIALLVGMALGTRRWRLVIVALALPIALAWAAPRALHGRLWLARVSADAFVHHPLAGQVFAPAFAEAQGERLRALPLPEAARRFVLTDSAHDDWLQAAVEGGVCAWLALAAAFALAWRAHPAWRAGRSTLIVIAIAACADAPLHRPAVLLLLVLVLAACPSSTSRWPRWPIAVACSAALTLAIPAWLAQRLATRALDEAPDVRQATLGTAAGLDPFSGPIAFAQGLCAAQRRDPSAVDHLERARRLIWQPATELLLADVWLARGDAEHALSLDLDLLRLEPGSLRARLGAAEALRRLGHEDAAKSLLREARRLWPSSPAIGAAEARLDEGY